MNRVKAAGVICAMVGLATIAIGVSMRNPQLTAAAVVPGVLTLLGGLVTYIVGRIPDQPKKRKPPVAHVPVGKRTAPPKQGHE